MSLKFNYISLFTFLFGCEAKRKMNRKEKHTIIDAAFGIVPLSRYEYNLFIRFCPKDKNLGEPK